MLTRGAKLSLLIIGTQQKRNCQREILPREPAVEPPSNCTLRNPTQIISFATGETSVPLSTPPSSAVPRCNRSPPTPSEENRMRLIKRKLSGEPCSLDAQKKTDRSFPTFHPFFPLISLIDGKTRRFPRTLLRNDPHTPNTHTHINTRTCTHSRTRTHTHAHAHARTHTHIHKYTLTHAHTRAYTYIDQLVASSLNFGSGLNPTIAAPLLPPPPPPSPQVPAFQTPSTDRLLLLRTTQRSESVQHRCVRATNESALIHFMTVYSYAHPSRCVILI